MALLLSWFLYLFVLILLETLIVDMTCRWPKLITRKYKSPENYVDHLRNSGKEPEFSVYDLPLSPSFVSRTMYGLGRQDKSRNDDSWRTRPQY
eukprot:UN14049